MPRPYRVPRAAPPPPRRPKRLKGLMPETFAGEEALRTVGRASATELGPRLHVLCWNILKAKRAAFAADFRRLVADRDLVLLQEAVLNAPSDALFDGTGAHEWTMARSFRDPRTAVEHGVKTGATASPLAASYHVSPYPEPLTRTPKLLLATRYALEGPGNDTLLVLNMHAVNFVSVAKYVRQLGQLVDALGTHAGPVLLAGDFNTWSVRRRASFFEVTGGARLVEAAMDRTTRITHLNSHLDHVFYRGLELRSVASLDGYASSDHAPIVATFEYRP